MTIKDLTERQLADRLRRDGVAVQMGPFVLKLGTTLGELVQPIHQLYAHFHIVDDADFIDFDVRVDPLSPLRRWIAPRVNCFVDRQPAFDPFKRRFALPMLEWVVNWCVFTRPNQYVILHAAVVERNGKAVLLPGPPGAGKSTLCAALSLRGWRLLSDEVAIMRPHSLDLVAVPRPIGLKEESIDVIRRFAPDAVIGPATPDTRKGTVAHVQVLADAVDRADDHPRPWMIVFPHYDPDATMIARPSPKGHCMLWIAQDAFNVSLLGADGFDTLADLMDNVDVYSLHYRDLDEAIAWFDQMLEQSNAAPTAQPKHAGVNV